MTTGPVHGLYKHALNNIITSTCPNKHIKYENKIVN